MKSQEEPHESEEQVESSESVSAECTATTAEEKNESQPLNCQFKARETDKTDNAIASSNTACWGPITEEVRSHWVSKGPLICQNKDSNFSASERI